MNDILKKLARTNKDNFEEAEGIDVLFLDAVHLRTFLYALDATNKESFGSSYLCRALTLGSTYSIVLKLMNLYDRENKDFEINTLRKLWQQVEGEDEEAIFISKQFDTRNKDSVFQPLKCFRDESLAHNQQKKHLTWEQIDKALFLCARVWHMVGKHSNSIMMLPFLEFEKVSGELDCIFSNTEIKNAKKAWNKYMSKIKEALNAPANL